MKRVDFNAGDERYLSRAYKKAGTEGIIMDIVVTEICCLFNMFNLYIITGGDL